MQGFWWSFNRSLQAGRLRGPERAECTYEGPTAPLLLMCLALLAGRVVDDWQTTLCLGWLLYSAYLAFAAARLATRIRMPIDPLGLAPPMSPSQRLAGKLAAAMLPLLVEIAVVAVPAAMLATHAGFGGPTIAGALAVLLLQPLCYGVCGAAAVVVSSGTGETQLRAVYNAVAVARASTFYMPVGALFAAAAFPPLALLLCLTNPCWTYLFFFSTWNTFDTISVPLTGILLVQVLLAISLFQFGARHLPMDEP